MQHQNTISWFSLLTGRASVYWSYAQQEHQRRMKIDRPTLRWTSAILHQLFHMAWDMWLHRNNIKNKTTMAAQQCEMDPLDDEINEHRIIGVEGIAGEDRGFLLLSIARQQRMSMEQKRHWLHTADNIRLAHTDRMLEPEVTNNPITDWFPV